jgi:S-adenosylmethionine hydrolase
MRWKSNHTKPTKNGIYDKVVIIDLFGNIYYNVELTGWGKSSKIGGKSWNEIKKNVVFWQYMHKLEVELLKKLAMKMTHNLAENKDYAKTLPDGFRLFGGENNGVSLDSSEQDFIQQVFQNAG